MAYFLKSKILYINLRDFCNKLFQIIVFLRASFVSNNRDDSDDGYDDDGGDEALQHSTTHVICTLIYALYTITS